VSAPVPEREAQRRLALLKAAFREVSEKGFADVTLDDIARRAGVSKGVTLYYFASKEDLFRRLFAWLVRSIHERMHEAVSSAEDPVEKLRALVAITFPSPSKNRTFFRAFVDFCGLAARREAFREVTARFYSGCREIDGAIIAEGVRRGLFVSRDAAAATTTIRAIFDGLMMQWLAESDLEASFAGYRDLCERELLGYLAPGRDFPQREPRASAPSAIPTVESPAP
jgi:AcrR family transcriptional regulator